jgi:pSer/pThr/pTyr-binding forkhead associated (FHA) protein/outer membrane biosynthesis protein TonB
MNLEIHYSPPNQSRQVVPVRDRLMIGSLLSNEVVIRAAGVEPIHAMIEVLENDVHILTDLGSQSGVYLNGQKVDVEAPVKIGDKITIGNVQIEVFAQAVAGAAQFQSAGNDKTQAGETTTYRGKTTVVAPQRVSYPDEDDDAEHADEMSEDSRSTVLADPRDGDRGSDSGEPLFSPRNAKPSGNVLEVVAYWDDTILDVDMFHPKIKNNERVTIGTPNKAHFLAGGTEDIKRYRLASVAKEGYTVHLKSDMTARIRKGGRVIEETGDKTIEMSKNDIAHVTHGAIKYFLMFIKPPVLDLPRSSARDPFMMGILALSALIYIGVVPLVLFNKNPKKDANDDIWSIVNTPDKMEVPKPIEKKKVEVAEVKKEPPPPVEPPKPPPKPPAPVKPEEKPKPVEVVKQPTPTPTPVKELAQKPTPVVTPPKAPTPEKKPAASGMAKAQDKPDMVNPGKVDKNKAQGAAGGPLAGGKRNDNAGGQRQGKESTDMAGVEGGAKDKPSGVNLGALGLGVGKVLNKSGAGAIKTDFKDSVGGAGGGSGSGAKTTGLGGPGAGKTLGVSGAGGASNNFGGGFGGTGSGAGGAGGLGGAGLGSGFGKGDGKGGSGRANVEVPPGDPVVSGGLTNQEVQAVIRANLNQIRHCYETLLQRSPNANGKIKVNFTISASGSVSATSINSDTIGDTNMAGCVTGKIVRWKFPTPRGGQQVQVTYPFVFNPM